MFHGRLSLNLLFLLLVLNFVSGSRLELMYLSLIVNIRSRLIRLHGFQLLVLLPLLIEITSFVCINKVNILHLKRNSDRLVIIIKGVLKADRLAYPIKTRESTSTSQKLGFCDFWQITNIVLNKGKSAIPPIFNGPEVLSSAFDKAKIFQKNFSKNSNLDDSGVSLVKSLRNL